VPIPGRLVGRAMFLLVVGIAIGGCGRSDYSERVCGNGSVEGDEQCDDGNDDNTDGCTEDCLWARCGDGWIREGIETCDDGNTLDGDECNSLCQACEGGTAQLFWPSNQHCYTRYDDQTWYLEAQALCASEGAALVTVTSAGEQAALTASIAKDIPTYYWLGLSDELDGQWRWVTGEPFAFVNWGEGAPNYPGDEHCAMANGATGAWDDYQCLTHPGGPIPRICENVGWLIRTADNHAYRILYDLTSWQGASSACAGLGAHLATITSAEEMNFLTENVFIEAWIGASDRDVAGEIAWITDEPFEFTAYAAGQPDELPEVCLTYTPDGWNDQACTATAAVLCEID